MLLLLNCFGIELLFNSHSNGVGRIVGREELLRGKVTTLRAASLDLIPDTTKQT